MMTDSPAPRRVLYLSRADVVVAGGGSSHLFIEAVERALVLHAEGDVVQPLKPYLRWRPNGHVADRIIAMPAYIGGDEPVAGLKWIGSKHDNHRLGLDRASALIVLNDPDTHYPIALLEGGLISGWRTAAVTALAARHLARPGFGSISCAGCGPVGLMQVTALLEQFDAVEEVHLFDTRPCIAHDAADRLSQRFPGTAVSVATSGAEAVAAGEVVITATVTEDQWLPFAWLQPGTFLANVSLMDAHDDVYLRADKVVIDDWDQCNREGKTIHRLAQAGLLSREGVHAELGQVLAGFRPGRESDEEIVVLNPMGLAVEDVACAQAVHHRALDAGVGTWLDLA